MKPRLLFITENSVTRAALRRNRFIDGHFHHIFANDDETALAMLRDRTRTIAIVVNDRITHEFGVGFSSLDQQPILIAFGRNPATSGQTITRVTDLVGLESFLRSQLSGAA